ncbi:MAG: cytochrome C biogenesis protein [Halioglobus sp.]
MSAFILACLGLVILSGAFYMLPRKHLPVDMESQADANLEWYRQRRAELPEGEETSLSQDMALRLLEDDTQAGAEAVQAATSNSFPRWLLLPVIGFSAGVLYFQLGAAPDVLINKQLAEMSEASTPEQLDSLLRAIETRSAQRPGNLHYTALLGRFYMNQQKYSAAAVSYGELAKSSPGDAQAMAYAAQAEYLAAGRKLNSRAQLYAEQALAIDPHQRTALGLLGMASFEQQQYRAAVEYWQRLLAMEPEGSDSAQMISGVIERAQEALQASGGELAQTHAVAPEPADVTLGVTVRLSFPADAKVGPQDTVFLLARSATADSRMPVAVQRLQAQQLPLTVRLDDSKSMAGQKLSELNSIVVVAQVSPDGRPGEASATWLAKAGPVKPSLDIDPIEVVLAPRSR